ncbi:hypothetical protein O0L34_g5776 [Tuta absoluta]|nr:hypothetical protein O0L34_g5776 [Tuta absoluta]
MAKCSAFLVNVLFSCFVSHVVGDACDFNVRLTQVLLNDGFHRNITYGIVFNADDERAKWMYQGCLLGIDQMLPRGVYANPDELEDLKRQNRVQAISKKRINVEMPTEASEPSSVYVFGKVTSSMVYLWLPVHARYHRARTGGGLARNEISKPKLYLRCPDQRLDTCHKDVTPAVFLCNGSSKEKCSWMEVPYTLMSSTPLIWDVPVGNTDHYYLVAGGTASVIIIGSVYLIKTIHEYKLREKIKKQ